LIHPSTELRWISDKVGRGVIATQPIAKGTILWTQCLYDIVLTPKHLNTLPVEYQEIASVYGYVDEVGDTILCWDLGRYLNHSCDPAMLSLGRNIEICVKDLAPGDELTCDYGTFNYGVTLRCECGRPNCRGEIRAEDALAFGDRWEKKLHEAVAEASGVKQPLLPFVQDMTEWLAYLDGRRAVPKPDSYYFHGRADNQ
jgi:hypothetical protein